MIYNERWSREAPHGWDKKLSSASADEGWRDGEGDAQRGDGSVREGQDGAEMAIHGVPPTILTLNFP